jgi:hypothetical protein
MAQTHSSGAGTDHPMVQHEESDINISGLFKAVAWLTVSAVVIQVVVWFMLAYFRSRAATTEQIQYPLAVGQEDRLPPLPRLQVEPRQDLDIYLASEQELLQGYRWIDKDAGVVRIPIEQAMKQVVERGLPARSTPRNGQPR